MHDHLLIINSFNAVRVFRGPEARLLHHAESVGADSSDFRKLRERGFAQVAPNLGLTLIDPALAEEVS